MCIRTIIVLTNTIDVSLENTEIENQRYNILNS